ncbi:MAG: CDP-diacylglycerol--glycerol-3-phosphate 3-phosphatidyltransferase [Chlamydiia bacterium]|nr:CDP-diacylglycerol--glycerol-3-phosphate 3-phosphatidyltransferase [Chlamydiia bacterium]
MKKNMLTLSNTISLLRAPLALLFLSESIKIRIFAIIAAMISDWIDGYLARKFKSETFLGKVLDPLMDKFFVYFVMGALAFQGTLSGFELFALLSRDLSIILYIIMTLATLGPSKLVYFPAYASKITTLLQFITLFAVILTYSLPIVIYYAFLLLAAIVFIELSLKTFFLPKSTV